MFEPQVEALRPHYRVDHLGQSWLRRHDRRRTALHLLGPGLGLPRPPGPPGHRPGRGRRDVPGRLRLVASRPPPRWERVRALVLLDSQAGTEDPEVVPLYQAMLDEWVATGPSDEIAQVVAGLIIGDSTLDPVWIARWKARPHVTIAGPGQTLITRDDITDRLGEIRRAGPGGPRNSRPVHHHGQGPGAGRRPSGPPRWCRWRAAPTRPISPTPDPSTRPSWPSWGTARLSRSPGLDAGTGPRLRGRRPMCSRGRGRSPVSLGH